MNLVIYTINICRYEECRFLLPEGEVLLMQDSKQFAENNLNIAIHTGPKEEMIAMATVDMKDLENIVSEPNCQKTQYYLPIQ